jgi:Protein of unknown function (DUF4230)
MKLTTSIAATVTASILAAGVVYYGMRPLGETLALPARAIDSVEKILSAWGQNKVTISVQNDILECKPIAEIALRNARVRSIVVHQTTVFGSSKKMIAHRAYDVKIGWDMKSDFKVAVNESTKTITVTASDPRVLSVTGVEPEAVIIHRDEGLVNKLTPEDMAVVMKTLDQNARESPDFGEAFSQARQDLQTLLSSVFGVTGFRTDVQFQPQKEG